MNFRSTRKRSKSCGLSSAMLHGLADDGGLYVPEEWPQLRIEANWADLDFPTFTHRILRPFFQSDPLAKKLEAVCKQAFDFPIPLLDLGNGTAALELFHGPTGAFKDFGARFLALCVRNSPAASTKPPMVLVATSGDTGGAVAAAFDQFTDIPVVILYPHGRISPRQEKQLTVWRKGVQAFAVSGSFDDCQRMVKDAFVSEWWNRRHRLMSANSINLGRLLPQMAYFAFAAVRYKREHGRDPGLIIPTGNAGNSVAALWAKHLGFPIRTVVFAHNANDTVFNYFNTGKWQARPTVATLANAMDVGAPSNFERVLDLYPNLEDLKLVASAASISDDQIRATIQREWEKNKRLWCPHSAVALHVRQTLNEPDWIVTATAHPAKFETVLEPLLKTTIDVPDALQALLAKPSHSRRLESNLVSLQAALSEASH